MPGVQTPWSSHGPETVQFSLQPTPVSQQLPELHFTEFQALAVLPFSEEVLCPSDTAEHCVVSSEPEVTWDWRQGERAVAAGEQERWKAECSDGMVLTQSTPQTIGE